MRGYLLVRAGALRCGLPVEAVRRVLDVERVHPSPGLHPAFLGVLPVGRGMVPFVHLAVMLEPRGAPAGRCPTAVLVECGGTVVALGVDDADAVVRAAPRPRPPGWEVPWVGGVAQREGRLVPVVDLEVLAERLGTASVSEAP